MSDLPIAQTLHRAPAGDADTFVTLDYDARFIRRKRLVTDAGWAFVIDLEQTTSLDHGDVLQTGDGKRIEVRAQAEDVLVITGDRLHRIAWHIGNRHTPCQIKADCLVIQRDPVIQHMLEHVGATVTAAVAPFTPEGGAYGHGRTHSHEHVATAHEH